MTQEAYIFEVNENNFQSVVVDNSSRLPVIVEFMGVWSEPCFIADHMFSELAREFAGLFIFAKVDIDEQPELRKQYRIENVPTFKVFNQGAELRTEEGQLNENEARKLLRDLNIFHASDEMREQARERHLAGDTPGAIMLLTQAIKQHPSNTRVAMDMVQIFIDIGDLDNANGLFGKLPEKEQNSDTGKRLSGQLGFLELAAKTDGPEALQVRVMADPDDHLARFELSICQVSMHEYTAALDNLFTILQMAPTFQDGAAKEMIITLIRMLTPAQPELAQSSQRRLNNLLSA